MLTVNSILEVMEIGNMDISIVWNALPVSVRALPTMGRFLAAVSTHLHVGVPLREWEIP